MPRQPSAAETPLSGELVLVYDQQCPLCARYARMLRLRKSAGNLRLVDAREDTEIRRQITARGLDIDQGMVLKAGGKFYYGADAVHAVALLSSRSGLFNRINFWVFRSSTLSRLCYPVLRFFRNCLLKLLGREKINNLELPNNNRF